MSTQDGKSNDQGSTGLIAYGNFVKVKHNDTYSTLYAHLEKGLPVKVGEYVKKGAFLGKMSDSGNAYGKHLHFEVFKNNTKINPYEYINKNFPGNNPSLKYQIGDTVKINGVYVSSTSNEKLNPKVNIGKITRIIPNTNNPYLLENGNIGWVNDQTIIEKINDDKYLSNPNYKGVSIVDALKEINIDSSYNYRKTLAKLNNINNYRGTATQNTTLLKLLKQGKLKY